MLRSKLNNIMLYVIKKKLEIHAAHNLTLPYESKCSRLHGHSYQAEVICASNELNAQGMVIDYNQIKNKIEKVLDHNYLNDLIKDVPNTTTEILGEWIINQIPDIIYSVELWESSNNCCKVYNEQHPIYKQWGVVSL